MFGFNRKKHQRILDDTVRCLEDNNKKNGQVSSSLQKNSDFIKDIYYENDILIVRNIQNRKDDNLKFVLVYSDGLVNSSTINESIIKTLMLSQMDDVNVSIDYISSQVLMVDEVEKTNEWQKLTEAINYGDTVLFMEGCNQALILNSKGFVTRSISEPESEKILSGPREGFNESIMQNLSMVRRRVRATDLKMKFYSFGERTKTKACLCYIDGLVDKKILKMVKKRLDKIDIDGVLDSNYLTELIQDHRWSPFPSIGTTERPDVVAGKILEGRVAIFVDGTPVVLTAPYLFIENFQSNEDYYLNYYYASFSRLLRIVAFVLTIAVPAYYVAIAAFHREMLPTPLFISIALEKRSVPLPAAVEAFIMLFVFDLLKETGIRMPTNVGQAMSIVGALVIGQSAVDAKLVAAPMIIVVALTGITNLLIPKLNSAGIVYRYFLLFCGSMIGLLGVTCGLALILIHILSLDSFGINQLVPMKSLKFQEYKDMPVRSPWWKMIKRPDMSTNEVRMNNKDENQT